MYFLRRAFGKVNRLFDQWTRIFFWRKWYGKFVANPHVLSAASVSSEQYHRIAAQAKVERDKEFIHTINERFGHLPDEQFVDDLAFVTQITNKKSTPTYIHGYLLYAALRAYLASHPAVHNINVLEIGTAKGFGTLMLAKALEDSGKAGKVFSIDVLPSSTRRYWGSIKDIEGPTTRFELLETWQHLLENYVIFLQGHSDLVLSQLGFMRVHLAFVDGEHTYEAVKYELSHIARLQRTGDVVLCDDYTPARYPGVVRAIDEVMDAQYQKEVFRATRTDRTYVYGERM